MAFPVSDDRLNGDLKSGYRVRAGMWIDKPNGTGVEAVFTSFLGTENVEPFCRRVELDPRPAVRGRGQRDPALFRLSDPTGTLQGIAAGAQYVRLGRPGIERDAAAARP